MSCPCDPQYNAVLQLLGNLNTNYNSILNTSTSYYNQVANISSNFVKINEVSNGSGNLNPFDLTVNGSANIAGNILFNNNLIYIDSSNKVGILNTNPQYTFDLKGNANIFGNLFVNNTLYVGNLSGLGDFVGIKKSNPSYHLDIVGNANISGNIIINQNGLFFNQTNNRLGIQNGNPQTTLDISGTANITGRLLCSSTSNITYNGNIFYLGTNRISEYNVLAVATAGSPTVFWTSLDIANATRNFTVIISGLYRSGSTAASGFVRYIGVRRAAGSNAVISTNVIDPSGGDNSYISAAITGGATAVNNLVLSIIAASTGRLIMKITPYYHNF